MSSMTAAAATTVGRSSSATMVGGGGSSTTTPSTTAGGGNDKDRPPTSATANNSTTSSSSKTTTTTTTTTRKKHNAVTPLYKQHQQIKTSLDHRMTVDKNIVDELLLVCGVIGSTTTHSSSSNTTNKDDNGGGEIVPVKECLNWLQDLQRALRRDEDLYRPISLLLGKWKVVEQKLLPLVHACRYDTAIVLTVVKIMVILTKPLSENTKRAGRMIIDTSSANADLPKAAQQIKLRDNAIAQANQLMEYKRIFAYHPSHITANSSNNKSKKKNNNSKSSSTSSNSNGLLSILVSLLASPLSRTGRDRKDADHLTIELVLHLIRNLLTAEPLLNTSSETHRQSQQLHQDMITLFDRELVLEILIVISQDMDAKKSANSQYNLLIMEILHHIFKSQDPTAVAKSSINQSTTSNISHSDQFVLSRAHEQEQQQQQQRQQRTSQSTIHNDKTTNTTSSSSSSSSSFLLSKLKQEKEQRRNMTGVRHNNFASTWTKRSADGREKPVTAAAVVASSSGGRGGNGGRSNSSGGSGGSSTTSSLAQQQTKITRKNRAAEPFIGSGRALLAHTAAHSVTDSGYGPATKRANITLHTFCQRFVKDCYGPFMKSLKYEFRRDSHRLEETDKVVFFRLVWFFSQWWRTSRRRGDKTIGQLIITMDFFMFNLVLNSTDTFEDRKQYPQLAQTVALYSEMLHLLHDMYTSGDTTEHAMAMALIAKLFYHGQEAMDRLPRLLSRWKTGISTREYVCDLVETCYMTLKLLDTNQRKGKEFLKSQNGTRGQTKSKNGSSTTNDDTIAKMRSVAADFDTNSYFVRKIVSNDLVIMYVHLLGRYKVNAPVVNHRIIAMFLRIMRFEIALPEVADEEMPINPLGSKRVTLEPMLYNLPMISVMEQILNDSMIRKDKNYDSLLQFCTNVMYNFWSAAETNPLLYVECLFRHPVHHRFCEQVTNVYVDEELRMMALRDLLREEQERLLAEEEDEDDNDGDDNGMDKTGTSNSRQNKKNDDNYDDDDDDEIEFSGDGVRAATEEEINEERKKEKLKRKRRMKAAARKKAAQKNNSSGDDDDDDKSLSSSKDEDDDSEEAKDSQETTDMNNQNDDDSTGGKQTTDGALRNEAPGQDTVQSSDHRPLESDTEEGDTLEQEQPEAKKRKLATTTTTTTSPVDNDDDGDDSSDDELLNDMAMSSSNDRSKSQPQSSRRMFLDDDDDSDDE